MCDEGGGDDRLAKGCRGGEHTVVMGHKSYQRARDCGRLSSPRNRLQQAAPFLLRGVLQNDGGSVAPYELNCSSKQPRGRATCPR